ncbi:MAG: isocitrate lyase/phosphoenolpyruvate mutase family protein [Gemmatimonadetes bacterium]|nr:isocitrate lyase/phosphoenolpyruvate mutase family protein [Gemmatimonadota bacterium]
MNKTTRLKSLINAPEILVMYPAHDALSARIAQGSGAKAITVGGFAASGVLLGQPDSSQLTATELATFYEGICSAVDIPVFVDADTGFGGVSNVIRTVRDFERAGVAGLFIEDQVFPKRCGHTTGKEIISTEEMLPKLKAALDHRIDEDLVIMGRTDALGVLGIEEAIARANLYRESGCDMVFVEAPETITQMQQICEEVDGPVLANMVDFGRSPLLSAKKLEEIGFAVGVWPVASVFLVSRALQALYRTMKESGSTVPLHGEMVDFEEYMDIVGLPELRDTEARYGPV